MKHDFIPVCSPLMSGNEERYVMEAVSTGWISSSGRYVNEFERAFAAFCGVKHGIAVTNGTAAIHLALIALGIGPGDEVIVPSFTMIGSVFPILYTGAVPVFVDAEIETYNIDPTLIEQKLTPRTRAILAVHIYGHPCAMDAIDSLAARHGLKVIEDAAEAHGATWQGRKCGSFGSVGAFSFFANKIVSTGEGGMVVTDDATLAEKCRYHRNLCFPMNEGRVYRHDHIGFNYRVSNLIAAVGLAQTERAAEYVAMRRRNHELYAEGLRGVPGLSLQPEKPGATNVYWMNGVMVDETVFGSNRGRNMNRDELMTTLKDEAIETRYFFLGMHRQPSLRHCPSSRDAYPVSDNLARRGILLPSGSGLTPDQIDRVCGVIRNLA